MLFNSHFGQIVSSLSDGRGALFRQLGVLAALLLIPGFSQMLVGGYLTKLMANLINDGIDFADGLFHDGFRSVLHGINRALTLPRMIQPT
ncbi:MAG: hypothetical protein R3F37_01175 [Candidatus Competibacteraceae bacterium]